MTISVGIGLAFVSLRKEFAWRYLWHERGTVLAFFAAVMMGGANFFMGWFFRLNDSLMGNFVTDIFIAVIAVALSESYIIIAVILGLAVNKERLERHQKIGLFVAMVSAIVLASTTA